MFAFLCRRRLVLLSIVTLLIASGICPGAVYQDLDFSVSFSTSWDDGDGKLVVMARWLAPKRSITSYRLYLDGHFAKYASGSSTSVSVAAIYKSYSSYARFTADVDAYLSKPHTYVLEARTAVGEDLYDVYEYRPPQVLVIENRMGDASEVGNGTFQIAHKQDGTEGLDARDVEYAPGLLPKQAKIVSTVWNAEAGSLTELQFDARPLHSTSSVSLQLSLVSVTGDPVVVSSLQRNELVFTLPGERYGNIFGSKPITIQQYDPLDPSREFPIYDVRTVIAKQGGAITLPGLQGTYGSGVPYACFRLSFSREVSGDVYNDGRLDLRDLAVLGDVWRHEMSSIADIASRDGLGLPDGRIDGLDLMAFCQKWARVIRDGFESGDLEALAWLESGFSFWKVVSSRSHTGSYCVQAGRIGDGGRTALIVSMSCGAGHIDFWRKVSSESNYDVLRFSIDQKVQAQWSGELDWERVSFPVQAGVRMFSWEYSKDDSSSSGDDTAWIDDVVFPAP